MNRNFWQGKRVLLTGHTGFKGSWFALWLSHLGARVCGFSLAPEESRPSLYEIAAVSSAIERSVIGDVRNLDILSHTVRSFEPEVVFHLAAQALVRRSYRDPAETFSTNVLGTVNILEACRGVPSITSIVNVTTDKCYENREWVWGYREGDRLGGSDPYSASKACSEIVTQSYRSSFYGAHGGALIATARAGNVIGGGDWSEDRIIPDIVRSLISRVPLEVRNPAAVRPWQHVLDPLMGYLTLAERLAGKDSDAAGAWNFGPSTPSQRPVAWIIDTFGGLFGEPVPWTKGEGGDLKETHFLRLDSSRARESLQWRPRLRVEEAIRWTAEWYRLWKTNPQDAVQLTHDQIARYEALSPIE